MNSLKFCDPQFLTFFHTTLFLCIRLGSPANTWRLFYKFSFFPSCFKQTFGNVFSLLQKGQAASLEFTYFWGQYFNLNVLISTSNQQISKLQGTERGRGSSLHSQEIWEQDPKFVITVSDVLSIVQDCLGGLRIRMGIVWDLFNPLFFLALPAQKSSCYKFKNESVFNFKQFSFQKYVIKDIIESNTEHLKIPFKTMNLTQYCIILSCPKPDTERLHSQMQGKISWEGFFMQEN